MNAPGEDRGTNVARQRGGGRPGKSASAFRTISEVAGELDVAQHVLRFWESKFPQVRPMKRGGGRRYYRPEDVDLLRQIRSLLYEEGYTIKGAQKLLRSQRRGAADDIENGADAVVEPSAEADAGLGPELRDPDESLDHQGRLRRLRGELVAMREALRNALG
jgi:DNA-binding transcriptional MerR regulator